MQKLQHSLASWFGFSGSPLFLPNGHVIGLHNSGRGVTIKGQDEEIKRHVELAYGVRVDCLWELLAYHHLDDKVPLPIDKSTLLLARYERPDPALERYRQAEKLVKEVDHLFLEKKYAEAADKCNAAIKLSPGYSRAYFARAVIYTAYNVAKFSPAASTSDPVNPEEVKYAALAEADAKTYLQMNPNDPEAVLFYCQKYCDLDVVRHVYNTQHREAAIQIATKIIDNPSVSQQLRARAYSVRAAVKTNVPDNHSIEDEIYADYNAAIRLDPFNPNMWRNRGGFAPAGSALESSDYRRANELDEADLTAGQAMWLATTPDDKSRDGRKAWEMAVKACQVTSYQKPAHLSALAAAYAESGDFAHAVEYAKKAIQLAEGDEKDQIRRELAAYEQQRPYRQPQD
jgi:hypothetical protein